MSAIIIGLFVVWIARAAIDVGIGIAQIVLGIMAGILALVVLVAAEIVEIIEDLWQAAFPTN